MKKNEVLRLYNFADATLVTKGLEKAAYMLRDRDYFDAYGITTTHTEALKADLNAFAARLTDVEALSDQTLITEAKDAKAEEVRTAIRNIMTRAELRYGTNSPKYKKFGTDALAHQTDSELLITGKRVQRVSDEFLAELNDHGLTGAMINDLRNLTEEFATLIIDLKIEIGDRDIEQEDRVEAGNIIYNTLVKYTKLGQDIWESSDVAKYNDYVLYNTFSGEPDTTAP